MYTPGIVDQTKTSRQSLDGVQILSFTGAAAPDSSFACACDHLGESPDLCPTTPYTTFFLSHHLALGTSTTNNPVNRAVL